MDFTFINPHVCLKNLSFIAEQAWLHHAHYLIAL